MFQEGYIYAVHTYLGVALIGILEVKKETIRFIVTDYIESEHIGEIHETPIYPVAIAYMYRIDDAANY